MSCLIQIFPSPVLSGIPVRLVLFISEILRMIQGLCSRITPFDIKRVIWRQFRFEITPKLLSDLLSWPYIFCENLMKLATIFQDLDFRASL